MRNVGVVSLISQKITELYIMLALVFTGCIVSHLVVAHIFDGQKARSAIFFKLYLPAYSSLFLIALIITIADHVSRARKDRLAGPYTNLQGPCRTMLRLTEGGHNRLLRTYVKNRLFVDYYTMIDYLRLWLDNLDAPSINKRFELLARNISLSSDDRHSYHVLRGITTIMSSEEIRSLSDAWTNELLSGPDGSKE